MTARVETARLALRPLVEEDAAALLTLWGDADVVRLTNFTIADAAKCADRTRWYVGRAAEGKHAGPLVIARKSDGAVVGLIGADHTDPRCGEFELWYATIKDFWGNGYAKEAALAFVPWLFQAFPGAARLTASAVPDNAASWRILEALGMVREGRLRRKFVKGPDAHDLYVYGLLRDEAFRAPPRA